jgi:hypothetical protein
VVDVHYPFGIGPSHCYRPGFNLTCHYPGGGKPPRLLLDSNGSFQVQEISLRDTSLLVTSSLALIEAVTVDTNSLSFDHYFTDSGDALYSLSSGNELVVSGCNVQATLLGPGDDPAILSGCATFCSGGDAEAGNVPIASGDKSCYGMGCCRAPISPSAGGMPDELRFEFADMNSVGDSLARPPYALIAREGWFDNRVVSDQQMRALQGKSRFAPNVPIVLRWEVLQSASASASSSAGIHAAAADEKSPQNCSAEVAADICKSKHSHCIRGDRGYSCQCRDGYHGNPYTAGGCKG